MLFLSKFQMNFKKTILIFIFSLLHWGLSAHPMPSSMVILKIHEKNISGEIQLPLGELQSAIGMGVNDNSVRLIERLGDSLRIYLLKHIKPRTLDGKPWKVSLGEMQVNETKSELSGEYKELVVQFTMTPPLSYDLRNFYFDYDVILHKVASHKALIAIKQDWQQGIMHEDGTPLDGTPPDGTPPDGTPPDSTMQQVGVIEWDVVNNKLNPFQISLQQGSVWKGFESMVSLGIKHISEGTDHILFILTLLLPAMLLSENKRWGKFIGNKSSLINLLKIVTAFTIGHSLTLLLGSIQWLNFPSKPIEMLIAITILISAFHAFRPIYPKKETIIAGSFGLIHGLAFAESLTNLQLSNKQLIMSVLGFNVGIELMQLFIILLAFPVLFFLSKTRYYMHIRQGCSILMMVLALAWLTERIQEKPNFITTFLD